MERGAGVTLAEARVVIEGQQRRIAQLERELGRRPTKAALLRVARRIEALAGGTKPPKLRPVSTLVAQTLAVVAKELGVTVGRLTWSQSGRDIELRHRAMWLLRRLGCSLSEVAGALRCHHTTVLYALRVIASRREWDDRLARDLDSHVARMSPGLVARNPGRPTGNQQLTGDTGGVAATMRDLHTTSHRGPTSHAPSIV